MQSLIQKFTIIIVLLIITGSVFNIQGQKKAEKSLFISELKQLSSVVDLPQYFNKTNSLQVSSYDRTGGNNDGFAGTYSYIRRKPDSTLVIFEAEGNGVINRIWTPTPTDDTLDFYFGGKSEPDLSMRFSDIFSGKQDPFIAPLCGNELGGYYSYLPIPYSKGCKIVFRGKVMRFLQIQYKELPENLSIENFSINLNKEEIDALNEVAEVWNMNKSIFNSADLLVEEHEVILSPGEKKVIFSSDCGGRILGIEMDNPDIFSNSDNNIDIKISYDDEKNPAIYAPAADFFGYAFGKPAMQSIVTGTNNNKNYCYLPMPFDHKASIELIYRAGLSEQVIQLNTQIYYSNEKRNTKHEGKLYASWLRILSSEEGVPLTMANIKGRGHYVGTVMQTQNLEPGMTLFFEGDDIAVIDGDTLIHGTGSEDYFNGGWYAFLDTWDRALSLPIHGSLDYSLTFGRTAAYRWHLTDKVGFNKSLNYTMEHGPVGNMEHVTNTTLGYYYCDSQKEEFTEPSNELSMVYTPDTYLLYPQMMKLNLWIDVEMKTEWCLPAGGYTYVFKLINDSKIRVSLDDIPHGKYKVYLDFQELPEGCALSLWQRQHQVSSEINTFAREKSRQEKYYVCDLEINESKNTLTFRFKTDQERNKFSLNRLILERTK